MIQADGGVSLLRSRQIFSRTRAGEMGQQVGRVGEGASAALQSPPHGHSQQPQPHQTKGSRASSSGRRPREATNAGTPACRLAVTANASDPGVNVFTLHSGKYTSNNPVQLAAVCFSAVKSVQGHSRNTRLSER